jgi:[ribosomal protein S18]-alanine N-acetyltransferase
MTISVTEMTERNLDAVLGIENLSFASPWSKNSFLYELQENKRAVYLAASEEERIIGYIGMWVILDEGHITNLAVHPDYRRHGVAWRLIETLTVTAADRGLARLTLEVRRTNYSAQQLYLKAGFVSAGVRPRYYRDNDEDALIMWKTLWIT